jgi:imidazole glycerol-phosphate synthase subunit HisF
MNQNAPNSMHFGASAPIFQNAKKLRTNLTASEIRLWEELSNKKLGGLKFRQQHPVGSFIADFYCHSAKLVIELDGSVHDTDEAKTRDLDRDALMKEWGLKIIRFRNSEVFEDLANVLKRILEAANPTAPLNP